MDDPKFKADQNTSNPPSPQESPGATAMFLNLVGAQAAEHEPPAEQQRSTSAVAPNTVSQKPARSESPPIPSSEADRPGKTSPGEFTQLFQRAEPISSKPPEVSPGESDVPPPQSVKQAAGDFTRIFVQVPRTGSASETPPMPPAVSERKKDAGTHDSSDPSKAVGFSPSIPEARNFSTPGPSDFVSGSGAFTKIFQRVKDEQSEAPTPGTPGEYTKIFQTPGSAERSSGFGEDQPFHLQSKSLDAEPRSTAKEFGLTKLMQALSEPGTKEWTPGDKLSGNSSEIFSSAQNQAEAGGLTSLSQRLSEPSRMASSPSRTVPPEPIQADAPEHAANLQLGEYTRIISGGLPRETDRSTELHLEKTRIEANPQPAFPAGLPPIAKVNAPHVPPVSTPPVAAVPQPPAIKVPVPPKGKLQEYLPILLILNAFLMLVVIFLVIFALRSH